MAYFRSANLGEPHEAFVGWFDLMGTRNMMAGPIRIAAQSIYKLHVAALEATCPEVTLYPVMDGVYAVSHSPEVMKRFTKDLFENVSLDLVKDSGKPGFQYLIRGAIAFGQVYHARDLPADASKILAENPEYRRSLFIGLPVTLAYTEESNAAPFGVAIHESAAQYFADQMIHNWWRWFDEAHREILKAKLNLYFQGARKFMQTSYPIERISAHEALVEQYLADIG